MKPEFEEAADLLEDKNVRLCFFLALFLITSDENLYLLCA